MKSLSLCLLFLTLISCGKNEGDGDAVRLQNSDATYLDLNNESDSSPELLTITVDGPIEISGATMRFLAGRGSTLVGRTIDCSFEVKLDEVWDYAVSGNRLELRSKTGETLTFVQQESQLVAPRGVWKSVVVEEGKRVQRRVAFLGNHFYFTQDCESWPGR